MSDWCILRTSGRNTLPLAKSLRRDGYDVWTPEEVFQKRAPRRRDLTDHSAPILPTFAFARSRHLHSLLALSDRSRKSCPDFHVFHYLDRIPLIADCELQALRTLEDDTRRALESEKLAAAKRSRKAEVQFKPGETVRIEGGAFAGMSGVVENDDGKFVLVCFGSMSVKIDSFLFGNDHIESAAQTAARAAA